MDLEELQDALVGLPIGPLRYYDQLGSTNAEAELWVDQGAPDLALVIADEQTAGRGRQGRKWFTPPGSALAFSLILRCNELIPNQSTALPTSPEIVSRMTALGALAISRALKSKYNLIAQIKWPNDVLLGGRKVAGVLPEASWLGNLLMAVILGIGINVAPESVPLEKRLNIPATCIQDVLGQPLSRLELLRSVLEHLLEYRKQLSEPKLLKDWEEQLAFRGEWVTFFSQQITPNSKDQGVRQGMVLGLDDKGGLRLRDHNGQEFTLVVGEIQPRLEEHE